MPRFVEELTLNDESIEELFAHGLHPDDVYEVLRANPKILPNKGRRARRRANHRERWKMIGPGRTGRLLTNIIEHPDHAGRAHVVTGWKSDRGDQTRHRQPGGRRNQP